MTKIKFIVKKLNDYFVTFILLSMFMVMSFALFKVVRDPAKGLASSEAAGWVQAIGSVAAILASTLIAVFQIRATERNRRRLERSHLIVILEILKVQIKSNLVAFQTGVGSILESGGDEGAFLGEFPVPNDATGIFSSLLPQLGEVRPRELRQQLILVANDWAVLVDRIRYNNQLFSEWRSLQTIVRRGGGEEDKRDLAEAFRALQHWGKGLSNQWAETKPRMIATLTTLDQRV